MLLLLQFPLSEMFLGKSDAVEERRSAAWEGEGVGLILQGTAGAHSSL